MEKYIFYGGKYIREIKEYGVNHIFVSDGYNGGIAYPKKEFYEIFKKAKMFDNFEDLIEIGDLCGYKHKETNEYSCGIFTGSIVQSFVDQLCFEVIEIYKHIGKDFIRVCHKENGSWVID